MVVRTTQPKSNFLSAIGSRSVPRAEGLPPSLPDRGKTCEFSPGLILAYPAVSVDTGVCRISRTSDLGVEPEVEVFL